jgi:hypothetical protein
MLVILSREGVVFRVLCRLSISLRFTSYLLLCPKLTDAPHSGCGASPPFLFQDGVFIHRVRTLSLSRVQDTYACSKYTKKSTPRCIHHRGVETPLCIHHRGVDYKYKFLYEYSKKFEIVPGHARWDQEKLFDEKNRTQKSCDTVPLIYSM